MDSSFEHNFKHKRHFIHEMNEKFNLYVSNKVLTDKFAFQFHFTSGSFSAELEVEISCMPGKIKSKDSH